MQLHLFVFFGMHNRDYLLQLYDEYAKRHGKTLDGIIEGWTIEGAIGRTLLAIITPVTEYYADWLYKAVKGVTVNEDQLTRIIVQQRERNLFAISDYYLHKHKKTLKEWISEECSFNFKKGLICLCEFSIDSKIP